MIHCLHGSAGCPSNWNQFQKSLGEEIKAVDLWSLFNSREHVTLHDAGKLVAEQAKKGDLLLGYSMGGRIALHSLLYQPEKWRGAIIIAANPGISEGHRERLKQDEQWAQLAETDWEKFLNEWNSQALFTSSGPFDHSSPDQAGKVARSFREWSLGCQVDLRPDFPEISCPVLWLTGERDQKFRATADDATPRIPKAQNVVIPNAGHRLPWDQPQLFSQAVNDFINDL